MKIMLIHPGAILTPSGMQIEYKKVPTNHLPLGILYLGQVLKDDGHKVILYDHYISQKPIKDVIDWIKRVNPDIIGFSVLSISIPTANVIAKEAKAWNPNLKIIYGGYIATFCAPQILKACEYVDFCVRGEGELTIIELVDKLEKNNSVDEVLGISYRKDGELIENPDRPLIKDLDTIPIPDHKLLKQTYTLSGKISPIISSRGCPFACRFCSCQTFTNGTWRIRSIENVMAEVQYLQTEGYNEIIFTDDCFIANQKRILKLCALLKREKFDLDWYATGHANRSDLNFLRTIVKAGCRTLIYGFESANQRILDYYNKKSTPEMALNAVKNAKKAGIEYILGGFMIGAPIETMDEVLNTINFGLNLQKYGLTAIQFQPLYLLPGTPLYREYSEQGFIDPERDWNRELVAVDVVPSPLKKEQLEILSKRAFEKFVTNKRFLITEFLKSAKSSYRLRSIQNFFKPR
jgi:radical SAM superfamily enzyme YgiQ (UPF0313 family)